MRSMKKTMTVVSLALALLFGAGTLNGTGEAEPAVEATRTDHPDDSDPVPTSTGARDPEEDDCIDVNEVIDHVNGLLRSGGSSAVESVNSLLDDRVERKICLPLGICEVIDRLVTPTECRDVEICEVVNRSAVWEKNRSASAKDKTLSACLLDYIERLVARVANDVSALQGSLGERLRSVPLNETLEEVAGRPIEPTEPLTEGVAMTGEQAVGASPPATTETLPDEATVASTAPMEPVSEPAGDPTAALSWVDDAGADASIEAPAVERPSAGEPPDDAQVDEPEDVFSP